MGKRFDTTRWTLVLRAREGSSSQARGALEELCEAYWYPLYAFVRRQGYDAEQARDLTQTYFATLLEKRYLSDVRPEAGRFRSFLLASLKHFLYNEWDKKQALKRGGHLKQVSLDASDAERRYAFEPADMATPEALYEQRWALTVLDRSLDRLRLHYEGSNRVPQFDAMRNCLVGDRESSYQEIAKSLSMTEGSVKVAVHRMRKRFGQCLRDEIAETVETSTEIDREIRHLLSTVEGWDPSVGGQRPSDVKNHPPKAD